jgi:hypothetical protein
VLARGELKTDNKECRERWEIRKRRGVGWCVEKGGWKKKVSCIHYRVKLNVATFKSSPIGLGSERQLCPRAFLREQSVCDTSLLIHFYAVVVYRVWLTSLLCFIKIWSVCLTSFLS